MTKKLLSLILLLCTVFSLCIGCSNDKSQTNGETDNQSAANSIDINIGCMKGPTAIGTIKLLSDSDNDASVNNYNYTIAGTADELSTMLIKGELDIAAVPCNLASVLYNKTEGEIVTVAINTLGVLYIVEAGQSINSVADLEGKTIYATGQGTTPEYTLRFWLLPLRFQDQTRTLSPSGFRELRFLRRYVPHIPPTYALFPELKEPAKIPM